MKQLIFFLTAIILISCSAEKKALKPYKAILNDTDTSFKEKKKDLGGRYCATNFPIEVKTIVKDSVVNRIVKVQDTKEINRLKSLLAIGCPTINIDSIYNLLPLDTLFIEHYNTKTITQKDSFQLRENQKQIAALIQTINVQNGEDYLKAAKIKEIEQHCIAAKKTANKWRLIAILIMVLTGGFFVLKLLKKINV